MIDFEHPKDNQIRCPYCRKLYVPGIVQDTAKDPNIVTTQPRFGVPDEEKICNECRYKYFNK